VIGWLLTQGPARKALGLIFGAAAILLFLLNLRRAGEHAGRAAERIDARERNDAIHRQMLDAAALLIVMLGLTGCATVGCDARAPCPPLVDDTAADQAARGRRGHGAAGRRGHRPDAERLRCVARPGARVSVRTARKITQHCLSQGCPITMTSISFIDD